MSIRPDGRPPFRADHIGSLLRPPALRQAFRRHAGKEISDEQFTRIQDDCVRDIVAFQESIGLPTITDGEFRRRSWSAGFIDAVDGFGLRDGTLAVRPPPALTLSSPGMNAAQRELHLVDRAGSGHLLATCRC